MVFLILGSVSSKRRMNLPLYMRAYSWLSSMALAEPKCRTQSGLGENRVTICLYLSAFGSGGSFFSSASLSFGFQANSSSTIAFCSASDKLLTSFTTALITPESSLTLLRSSAFSPRIFTNHCACLRFAIMRNRV